MATAMIKSATRGRNEVPRVTIVYAGEAGIHHSRCGQRIEFRGNRGGLELEFYCRACHEHVTLPDHVLARIPTVRPTEV